MPEFAKSLENSSGLVGVHVLSEKGGTTLVGISMWDDEDSFNRAMARISHKEPTVPIETLRKDPPIVRKFLEV